LEAADHRRIEGAAAIVGPVDRPQPGRGVEQAEGRALQRLAVGEALGLVRVGVAEAAQDGMDLGPRHELVPAGVAMQARAQVLVGHVPATEQEVEVVAAVVVGGRAHGHCSVDARRPRGGGRDVQEVSAVEHASTVARRPRGVYSQIERDR
jgi:hypothetical protein